MLFTWNILNSKYVNSDLEVFGEDIPMYMQIRCLKGGMEVLKLRKYLNNFKQNYQKMLRAKSKDLGQIV